MQRVLVLGVPRSGTTWIGRALGACDGARYVHEPDGVHEPYAYRAKFRLGPVPVVRPGTTGPDLAEYGQLWAGAFAGGAVDEGIANRVARRCYAGVGAEARAEAREGAAMPWGLRVACALARPRRAAAADAVVVKSVDAALAAEWIVERFEPRVLVIHRDLRSVLGSWLSLGMGNTRAAGYERACGYARDEWGIDLPRFEDAPVLERSAVVCATWARALDAACARHADWVVVGHEAVCLDPNAELRAVAATLGLRWGSAADAFLASSEGDGAGFVTRRVASEQVDSWKQRLDADQVAIVERVTEWFTPV